MRIISFFYELLISRRRWSYTNYRRALERSSYLLLVLGMALYVVVHNDTRH